jgi:hypothetical protein
MTDMVAVIAGSGKVLYETVESELDDFLPVASVVFIPGYPDSVIPPEGEVVVKRWMDFSDQDYVEADTTQFFMQSLTYMPDVEHVMITIGTEFRRPIENALSAGWDVFDLCRGLFPVTQADLESEDAEMPLDGPEINADGLSGNLGMITHGTDSEPYDGSEGLTKKEIEEIVAGYIQVHEQKFHGAPVESVMQEDVAKPEMPEPGWVRCYKSKTGRIRKAGRSKMKPGETEILVDPELLQQELDAPSLGG